jgi:hypothetical protein
VLAVVPVVVLLQVLYPPVQRWRSPMGAQLADEAAAAPVLSTTEIEAFKADGVLILPGFIDEEQLASWRCQAWAAVGADPDDRTTWPTGLQPNLTVAPHLGELPQCQALMEQLGGGAFTGGGTMRQRRRTGAPQLAAMLTGTTSRGSAPATTAAASRSTSTMWRKKAAASRSGLAAIAACMSFSGRTRSRLTAALR